MNILFWAMERKSFQAEMEVNGRISVEPSDDFLRLKAVSNDISRRNLGLSSNYFNCK